ncbi:MAG: CHASE2 domain-containing protein [Iphinoe sp. HA4291-MV1]|jgi:CHASE2 domain-containing sensor protein/predicted Ser/Thr protein kinase|nr:CHASE2 domain-containing protein [Iphinoe sp. HA4291-MV1]
MTGLLQKLRASRAKDRGRLTVRASSSVQASNRYGDTLVERKPEELDLTDAPKQEHSFGQNNAPKGWLRTLLVTSLGVTALVLGVRELQWLQSWELRAYDQMLRLRPLEAPDPRILLVTVTEDDVRQHGWPLSDNKINNLLEKLQSYQPRVIGLNIYRPEQKNMGAGLKRRDNVFSTCVFSSMGMPEVTPPPNFPIDNVGFTDVISDEDGIVRRSLLFAHSPQDKKCTTNLSFATQLAISFLEKEGIEPDSSDENNFKLVDTHSKKVKANFQVLDSNTGGYKKIDDGGYQVMLNYHNPDKFTKEVTLTQALNGNINPNWIKDRLVIIGTKSPSLHPGFYTPYSALPDQPARMPAVFIHAQIASQVMSAALDGRPVVWYFSEWAEGVWVLVWSLLGAALAWRVRHPLLLVVVGGITLGSLVVICVGLFLQAGWVPIIPPAIALLLSGISVMVYTTYRTQQETKVVILQVEKQQEAIEQLNTLLKESTAIKDKHLHISSKVHSPEKTTGDSVLSGRYKITKVLGSGGFGCTYLAEDTQRPGNPICVVKQLMPARRDTKFLQVARRLFDTEAEILEALGKHNQIPQLLAYFEDNNEFFLVQEYIQGHSLSEELPPVRGVEHELFVIDMIKGILEILVFVHEHRVIHRDIKPSNIIRRAKDNQLVLIDFGAVKMMQPPSQEQTELATVAIGTRGYAPPEQFAGHPRLCSDIYALGMIGIQAVTGLSPHELQPNSDTGNIMWRQWARVREEFAEILDKMVCYHFSDRYQSASAVLQDLKQIT